MSPADVSVRVAGPNDAPAVGVVQAAVWVDAYAAWVPAEVAEAFRPEAFARAWRDSLTAPPAGIHRLLVALTHGRVVGFAAIGPAQDRDAGPEVAELTALGVHPDSRRAGHGSRLLNAAVDMLTDAGATGVNVWVRRGDDTTLAFLRASGFAPDGAHRSRIVSQAGQTLGEVRLTAALTPGAVSEGPGRGQP